MRDLGNWKSSGEYTIAGLDKENVYTYMDEWMGKFKEKARMKGVSVLVQREDCKLPNMAREIGGLIGMIGKMASQTVVGYNIKDDSGTPNRSGKKNVLFDVYLVPQNIQGGIVVEAYVFTWYGTSLKNAEKAMGESLLNATSQLLNEAFEEM